MLRGTFRTKSLSDILAAAEDSSHSLRRSLGPVHVTLLGIGAIIGAGIFATVGEAAAGVSGKAGAGPSLMLSFTLTAIACGFTALCYAEFASMVPIAGSAYTYSYATLGELIAWIIGWDLILEYAVGNTAVAISWAGYFRTFLHGIGIDVPIWLSIDYRSAVRDGLADQLPHLFGIPIAFNALAFGIVAALTIILVWGIRESAAFNAGMVVVKIIVLAFFVGLAFYYVSPQKMAANWRPFQPNGWAGTFTGAAVIFFAYIGFDAVSTVAEETRNPKRDLPIGIFASLIICTVIYIIVAGVFTGLMPYSELQKRSPRELAESLTMALDYVAPHQTWATNIVALGSVIAHTAVLLVFQMGQPRIFFSMARDGLLPPMFAKVHPRFKTPHVTTILTGLAVGSVAAVTNIDEMVALTNIGTLFAFVLVCIGIIVLRYKDPARHRPFRVPLGAWPLPIAGAASCLFLMYYLPPASWWRFVGWLVLGLSIYFYYGFTHSALRNVRPPWRKDVAPPPHVAQPRNVAQPPSAVARGDTVAPAVSAMWHRLSASDSPPAPSASLKLIAGGFLLIAIGLFTIPHDAGLADLLRSAASGESPSHTRCLAGLAIILLGAAAACWGSAKILFASRRLA